MVQDRSDTAEVDTPVPALERSDQEGLRTHQRERLRSVLAEVLPRNELYRHKLRGAGLRDPRDLRSLDDLRELPFTTKDELSRNQVESPPFGTNLTFDLGRYIRIHQTSGTTGDPLRWLDTAESWNWWARCWCAVYRGAGVTRSDRIFFAFSFGPFIGFWSAQEGARLLGAMAIPGGGMSTEQRLKAILANDVSVLVCTPTYALHMAEVARQQNIDISSSSVRVTVHAGEPGANIPATKHRIERAWGARCFDHAGATEVGAWGFECQAQAGLHLNEGEFIFEVVDPVSDAPAEDGELVVTNLGRAGMPVIRYRTGDRVRYQSGPCECGRTLQRLAGGVIGRVDDVLHIRGVNVYPSSIEQLVRRVPEIGEFAVDVFRHGELDELEIRIEVNGGDPEHIAAEVATEIRHNLSLRAKVTPVSYGALPRFDLKARRFVDHRAQGLTE